MKSLQTNEYLQIFVKNTSLQIHLPSSLQSSTAVWDREEKKALESNCLGFEPWLTHSLTVDKLQVLSVPHLCVLSHFSHVWHCATLWTTARQTPLSMGFSRQKYWSGLPCPPPGDLPNPGIKPRSPALQADSSPSELQGNPPYLFLSLSLKLGIKEYLPHKTMMSKRAHHYKSFRKVPDTQ